MRGSVRQRDCPVDKREYNIGRMCIINCNGKHQYAIYISGRIAGQSRQGTSVGISFGDSRAFFERRVVAEAGGCHERDRNPSAAFPPEAEDRAVLFLERQCLSERTVLLVFVRYRSYKEGFRKMRKPSLYPMSGPALSAGGSFFPGPNGLRLRCGRGRFRLPRRFPFHSGRSRPPRADRN